MNCKRIARKLVERHGFLTALRKASDRLDRYRPRTHDAAIAEPGRLTVWTTITQNILAMPIPAASELSPSALHTAVRLGYHEAA